jgi:hypothetical protein
MANAQAAAMAKRPVLWPLVFFNNTLATTPFPMYNTAAVPANSPQKIELIY